MNIILGLTSINFCYVITTSFLTTPIYYMLQNGQWCDEYSVHKMNPDIHFICELHATVRLHRAAFSLSKADSHSFPEIY